MAVRRERLQSIGWRAPAWERMLHDARIRERTILADAEDSVSYTVAKALIATVTAEPERLPSGEKKHPNQPDPIEMSRKMAQGVEDNAALATKLLGRGIYSAIYGIPEEADKGPAWAQTLAKAIGSARGFAEMRDIIGLDPDAAGIATTALLREVEGMIPDLIQKIWEVGQNPSSAPAKPEAEEPCDSEQNGPGQNNQGQGQNGSQGQNGPQGGTQGDGTGGAGESQSDGPRGESGASQGPGGPLDQIAKDMASALTMGVMRARTEAVEAIAALSGLLPGLASVPARYAQEDPRRMTLAKQLASDERMKKLLRIAGRIERISDRVRRTKHSEIPEEVTGISTGDDLGAILSSELMTMFDDDIGILQLARFADKQMLQFEREGATEVGRGPVRVLLDISGSMEDTLSDGLRRIDWATIVAIALVKSAITQRRDVRIATFNGDVQDTWVVQSGDSAAAESTILALMTIQACGGTSFDGPIMWAIEHGAVADKADLVIVTDGAGSVGPRTMRALSEAKNNGLRLWGVVAGDGSFDAHTLGEIVDGVVIMSEDESENSSVFGELAI